MADRGRSEQPSGAGKVDVHEADTSKDRGSTENPADSAENDGESSMTVSDPQTGGRAVIDSSDAK